MEKETKECIWCKDIKDDDEEDSIYNKNDPRLFLVSSDPYEAAEARINFCPWCGRRLREVLIEGSAYNK